MGPEPRSLREKTGAWDPCSEGDRGVKCSSEVMKSCCLSCGFPPALWGELTVFPTVVHMCPEV